MIRLLVLLGAVLSWAAPAIAVTAGAGVSASDGVVTTDSTAANFLANSSSLSCSSSPGKLIVDSTADALSYCSSAGSTVKYAALGNDSGDAAGIVDGTIVNADVNASAAIALSKLANIASDRILGRDTASSGAIEELTVGGGVEFTGSTGIQRSALTGDVTASAGSNTTAIASGVIVNADVNASAAIDVSKTALVDGAGLLLSTNTLATASTETNFLANAASVTCSSSPGKLIVDTTAETLAYCDGAVGSTQKWAALGDDSGDAVGIAANTIVGGDIQNGVIAPGKMTESFAQSYAGTGLTFDTTTSPDTLKIAANGVTLATDTTGNFVATVAGTSNEVSVSGSGSEDAAVTVSLPSTIDLGGKTSLELPNGSAPTTNVFGQIAGDNDAWAASRGAPQWYDGTANTYLVGALVSDTPADGQVPKWNTGGTVTWEEDGGGVESHAITPETLGLSCDYSANDTATLRTALESGGTAAGKTLFIPSGCKILLGSPGAGDSVADLGSGTSIQCEDATAGFVLARKSCSGSSETPGAACTADNQCTGGTCDPDYTAGDSFAPTEASTYTVFGAASSATRVSIRRCSIWANGSSKDYDYRGGTGKRWGYCDGAGGSDVTGQGCAATCNSSSGALYGLACTTNADCGAGSCVENYGDCKTGGGACTAVPYTTNWGPSGAGKIHPIDFSNATYATVEGVNVYDLRRGDFAVKTGTSGTVRDSRMDNETSTVAQVDTWINYSFQPSLSTGLIASYGTYVENSTASGWDIGIEALGSNTLVNVTGGGYGSPTESTWKGATGLQISSDRVEAYSFRGGTGLLNCVRPKFGLGSTGGYNFLVAQPYCDNQIGPKFIVQGAGNQYIGVRGAWSGRGSVVGLGDQRGRCSGGTRSGKVCTFGAGVDTTIGCPGSSCAVHDDFPAEGATHFFVSGGSLLHTSRYCQGGSNDGTSCLADSTCTGGGTCAGVSFIRTTDGKRCNAGSRPGLGCSVDGDCTGGSTGSCQPLGYYSGVVNDVNFYNGSGSTGIDVSTSSVGVDTRSGYGPSVSGWQVSGFLAGGFATALKFPSVARYCVGGTNVGASCTTDATCTGSGLCKGPVENFVASGNVSGSTAPLSNWDWSYGDVSGLAGLLVTDDQGGIVTYTAGEALTKGQLVKLSTTANQVTKVATSDTGEQAVGVVLADTLSGYPTRVMRTGSASCISDTGTVAAGDLLERGTTTAGRVQTSNATSDNIVGAALEADGASGSTFRCSVRPPAVQAATATPFQTQILTSDAATQANDTVVNTQFSFSLSANKGYILDGSLIVTGGATGDMRCNLDGPASMTTVLHGYVSSSGTFTVSGDNTNGKCLDVVAGADNVVTVGGLIVTGANSGTLNWGWAQQTSNGTGTTVKAGSWMRIMER